MRISTDKKIAGIALGAMVVAGTGVAYAYWSTQGTGTGSGSTSAGDPAAFTVRGDVPGQLFPGDAARTVTATVQNVGAEHYRVAVLKAYVTTDKEGCTGSDYRINGEAAPSTAQTAVDLGITAVDLAPRDTQDRTYSFQFNNKADVAQNACKGAAVTVHYIAG